MNIRWLISDVVIEHLRSRMVYLYLIIIIVAITSILLMVSLSSEKRDEGTWFSSLMKLSSQEHLRRLQTPLQKGLKEIEPLPPLDDKEEYSKADAYQMIKEELDPGLPLLIFELPGARTCSIAIVGRGGICEEGEGSIGVTQYICELSNYYVYKHPEEFPFLEEPMLSRYEGVVFKSECLPEYFLSQLSRMGRFITSPPLNPEENHWHVLFNIRKKIDDRKNDIAIVSEDLLRSKMFSGHALGLNTYGKYKDMLSKSSEDLVLALKKLFSPGRCAVIVAGPIQFGSMIPEIRNALSALCDRENQEFVMPTYKWSSKEGMFSEHRRNTKRSACAAGLILKPQDTQLGPVFSNLFDESFSELFWRLRSRGLIYGGTKKNYHPDERDLAFSFVFTCSPHKARALIVELQQWFTDFPDALSDEYLDDLLATLLNRARRSKLYPSYAMYRGIEYYLNPDWIIVDPEREEEIWREMSKGKVREILNIRKLEPAIILGTVGSSEGGVL